MNLLGRAMEKNFWEEVREKECFHAFRNNLLQDWDRIEAEGDLKALRYRDFKKFFVDGNRRVYEAAYTAHRHALTTSAFLALIYPEEEKYINFLMDAIYTICDEYTWCLPAHQPKFEENNNCHIDLCASGMAFYLSEIYTLFGERLDPLIRSRINAELDRRVFKPFLENVPYSWWETGTSNWTAVCTGSVACAFMLMRPEKAKELIPRFTKSMEGFISGFSDEGVCYEGGGYWNYGFGNFLPYADMIEKFTDGEINYFKIPKIKLISTFYYKIFLTGNVVANFADCGEFGGRVIGRMHFLSKKYPDEMKNSGCSKSSFSHTYEFPTRLREVLWFYEEEFDGAEQESESEFYAPEAEWLIKRNENYGFAAKGGHNAEHHNHNDVGHFIFAKNGKQILCDLGSGVYTKQYFSPERYKILETSARSHSVPIIDGTLQHNGKEFAAREFKFEGGVLTVDIAGAYENLSADEKIERSFTLGERGVKLTDKFTFKNERAVTERFTTKIQPDISTRGIVYIEDVALKYDADAWNVSLSSEPASKKDTVCYMIDFTPLCKVESFVLTVGDFE